jgi:hypothetical protein
MGSATAQDIGVDNPTAIVCAAVIGDYLGHRSPLMVREVSKKTLGHLTRRVFQSPCLRLQFLKSGERRSEVRLFEDLAAVDPVAFDSQK